jgi:hypothetical protein
MPEKKEPMIGKENRPTAIDYDAPLAGMKVRDLLQILSAHHAEQAKAHYLEFYKPEYWKPEYWKPEVGKVPETFKEHKEGPKEKT